MPLKRLQSRTQRNILRDQGAPKGIDADEQMNGTTLDDISRDDWPEGEDITSGDTPSNSRDGFSGVKRKTGQLGTT